MLILTRKPGETIVINNEIIISWEKSTNPGQVKFSIDAPKHISIHRGEIQERINNGEPWEKST